MSLISKLSRWRRLYPPVGQPWSAMLKIYFKISIKSQSRVLFKIKLIFWLQFRDDLERYSPGENLVAALLIPEKEAPTVVVS